MAEKQWSCGCHEVDGKLVVECTQDANAPVKTGQKSLYSPVCFRKQEERTAAKVKADLEAADAKRHAVQAEVKAQKAAEHQPPVKSEPVPEVPDGVQK